MKKFLKNLFLFTCLIIAVAYICQVIILLRIKGKTIRGHDNLEQTGNVNADLVFLGSSRCWSHFDPHFFDSTFKLKSVNIGVDGHSELNMAIIRLKDYLSRNQIPKFAILNFDPFMQSGNEINFTNFVHKNDFARYAFFPKKKDLYLINYFKFTTAEKYIPLYAIFKYQLLHDCIFQDNISNYTKYGYQRYNEHWDTTLNPIKDTLKKEFFTKKQIPLITNSLNELNELCKKNDIRLLCIQTPVYKVLRKSDNFLITKSICDFLKIPFIDVDEQFIMNNIYFFYNSNHLNKEGVEQMNLILAHNTIVNSFLNH